MTKRGLGILVVLVCLALLLGSFGCSQQAAVETPQTLTIGVSAAMSGTGSAYGVAQERAVNIAAKDINDKGGVKIGGAKYLLQVKTYDNAYDPAKGLEVAKRLVDVDKVFMISTHATAALKPVLPVTEEKKMLVTHLTTGKDIMTFMPENYAFRCVQDIYVSEAALWQYLIKTYPDMKTTAFLKPDDSGGRDEAKDNKGIVENLGVKLVYEGYYTRGVTDFYPALTALLAAKPASIDLGGSVSPADQGRIIKQARELGFKGKIVTMYAANIQPILDMAGAAAAEGFIYTASVDPNSSFATAEEKAFYTRMMEAYNSFDIYCLQVVMGIYPVFQAAEKVNSLDPTKIAESLHKDKFTVMGREVWSGGTSIYGQPARQLLYPIALYTVEGGKGKIVSVLEPPKDF